LDVNAMKKSWNQLAQLGDQVPLFFYSSMFLMHPDLRELFPVSMAGQRDKFVRALGRIVSNVDRIEQLTPFIEQLGRDHRKFSIAPEHYPKVGEAFLFTLEHFLGESWTPELAKDWAAAYGLVSQTMIAAAEGAARTTPAWWNAQVVEHELRSPEIAVLTLRPDQRLDYLPGQSVAVETSMRRGLWRYYSPANAPRRDGTIELHVRRVDHGPVSGVLTHVIRPGDWLRVGPPTGSGLVLHPESTRDIVLAAGGTGITPFKAMIEYLARHQDPRSPRNVHLFWGARRNRDLYDIASVRALDEAYDWLRVVTSVSEEPPAAGLQAGTVAEVLLGSGRWDACDVYVCGSPQMMTETLTALLRSGITRERIRVEEFGGDGPYSRVNARPTNGGPQGQRQDSWGRPRVVASTGARQDPGEEVAR
jgi:NAD(P)H-flavin reductase/hemoglobin-like flavoprotein